MKAKKDSSLQTRIIFDAVMFSIAGYIIYWGFINKTSPELVSLYLLILGLSAITVGLLIRNRAKEERQTQQQNKG